ncbi:nucleotidyl transferase AbiEii/AbiGii toxin family protein [Candidatus Bathyarchaeota archaeon]|nr:nucleotidyl transferase AbiEii/AbiGii toxin family protein [Candidatus Bathyarchaeota archaeon]
MIPDEEIKEIARMYGVPTSTVERDYAQGWLLASLSTRFNMAFKGGTSIRKIHLKDYRFSDDLDFTLLEDYSKDQVQGNILDAAQEAKASSGINYENAVSINEVTNGFRATVEFRILRVGGNSINIKLDLTKQQNETVVLPLERRPVFHPYSDGLNVSVLSYSLTEILSEKIRALFQRTRPRDLYDVWKLSELKLDVPNILREKFDFKDVTFDIEELNLKREDFGNAWENSLGHQISDLPDFDSVFGKVKAYLRLFE